MSKTPACTKTTETLLPTVPGSAATEGSASNAASIAEADGLDDRVGVVLAPNVNASPPVVKSGRSPSINRWDSRTSNSPPIEFWSPSTRNRMSKEADPACTTLTPPAAEMVLRRLSAFSISCAVAPFGNGGVVTPSNPRINWPVGNGARLARFILCTSTTGGTAWSSPRVCSIALKTVLPETVSRTERVRSPGNFSVTGKTTLPEKSSVVENEVIAPSTIVSIPTGTCSSPVMIAWSPFELNVTMYVPLAPSATLTLPVPAGTLVLRMDASPFRAAATCSLVAPPGRTPVVLAPKVSVNGLFSTSAPSRSTSCLLSFRVILDTFSANSGTSVRPATMEAIALALTSLTLPARPDLPFARDALPPAPTKIPPIASYPKISPLRTPMS